MEPEPSPPHGHLHVANDSGSGVILLQADGTPAGASAGPVIWLLRWIAESALCVRSCRRRHFASVSPPGTAYHPGQ